jgi:hypothetical protein
MSFNFLAIVVLLNVMATIALWRAAARRPEKVKRKFTAALLRGEPITPQHQPPQAIGERFSSLVSTEDQQFFEDFADFADVVNWWLADAHDGSPWRLQELPDTVLRLQFSEDPTFGRRYSIFHNQVRLGTLEVSPGYKYSTEKPNMHTEIELEYVRLLHYDDIGEFLSAIAVHVCDTTEDRVQWRMAIESATTRALWQMQHISEFGMDDEDYGELRLQFNDSADWYFRRRSASAFATHRTGPR